MTKYIFVTGGVVSGLGKGITAASLGRLLKTRGLKVAAQALDPSVTPQEVRDMSMREIRDRLEELADRRRRDSRQRERLLWAAALSGAGLFIILLI